ncbi:MAG: FIST C-terminal domain-containing protein [Lachnospiraceae bacterium]|nr:FIST C-terminal domain-containing protein [Lachnospiraceae bacterium]
MKQFFGASKSGNLKEAVRGISNPQLIMLMSNAEQFDEHVRELEELYPGIPSIGCIGMSYDSKVVEKGVGIVAYYDGVTAVANVLEQVSDMPVKYIKRLEEDVAGVRAEQKNTVVIDFCAGNDACVLTTMYSVLKRRNISLVGGTGDAGRVSANGRVYTDAVAYAVIKNNGGKIKAYKENIYHQMEGYRFVASRTDRKKYILGELNGKPAKQVYQDILNITEKEITTQTFKNPFGKLNGDDTCIISIKEVSGNALACYRQVNDSDVLNLLELGDYKATVQETINQIHRDFSKISAVFSVNCLFRYLLFTDNNYMDEYLKLMSTLDGHAGLVGYGEHYNNCFVNQSMTCVVFE